MCQESELLFHFLGIHRCLWQKISRERFSTDISTILTFLPNSRRTSRVHIDVSRNISKKIYIFHSFLKSRRTDPKRNPFDEIRTNRAIPETHTSLSIRTLQVFAGCQEGTGQVRNMSTSSRNAASPQWTQFTGNVPACEDHKPLYTDMMAASHPAPFPRAGYQFNHYRSFDSRRSAPVENTHVPRNRECSVCFVPISSNGVQQRAICFTI